jgi:hypothetical protein
MIAQEILLVKGKESQEADLARQDAEEQAVS